jgi:uncharacterized protein (TIGR00369 family)
MSHVLHDESDPVSGRVRLPAETGAPLPGLPGLLGIELRSASADAAEAMLLVTGNHLAVTGYLHAGCVVTLADTVCGYGCLAALPSRAAGFTTIELTSNHLSSAAAAISCARSRPRCIWAGRPRSGMPRSRRHHPAPSRSSSQFSDARNSS